MDKQKKKIILFDSTHYAMMEKEGNHFERRGKEYGFCYGYVDFSNSSAKFYYDCRDK